MTNFSKSAFPTLLLISSILLSTPLAAENNAPDLQGLWKTSYVSLDDPRWTITDLACSGWCSKVTYDHLDLLLSRPENNERSIKELLAEAQAYGKVHLDTLLTPLAKKKQAEYDPANDPAVDCDPDGDGLRHQITAPLPIRIDQYQDKVVINYEYWKAIRTVHLNGQPPPGNTKPSRLGYSVGHYEGATLVIETTHIQPALISLPGGYIRHSKDAKLIERYTRTGDRLDLVWEIVDPVHFRQAYVGLKASLHEPDWELDEFVCEAITGEF